MNKKLIVLIIVAIALIGGYLWYKNTQQTVIPAVVMTDESELNVPSEVTIPEDIKEAIEEATED